MKKAVAHLIPFMEAEKLEIARKRAEAGLEKEEEGDAHAGGGGSGNARSMPRADACCTVASALRTHPHASPRQHHPRKNQPHHSTTCRHYRRHGRTCHCQG